MRIVRWWMAWVLVGSGKSKAESGKIQSCLEEARKDGLQYIWVDTCCIDKRNSTELVEAICDFHSREGKWLGDKNTLENEIQEITGVAIMGLRCVPLSTFSVRERMP